MLSLLMDDWFIQETAIFMQEAMESFQFYNQWSNKCLFYVMFYIDDLYISVDLILVFIKWVE